MIDIKKELAKYKPIDIDEKVKYEGSISVLLNSFNKSVNRIGKDQYRSLKHIEDVVDALEEIDAFKNTLEDIKIQLKSKEETEQILIKLIIEISELTENMYIYSLKSNDLDFRKQVELQWKTLQNSLLKCGITPFGNKGDDFDSTIHTVVEVKESSDYLHGQVLEVIRRGYFYKGNLYKKAEVIVNAIEPVSIKGENNNE